MTKGRLLVAAPPLGDPNFDRAVVFVVEHNDDGALGIVLNRPTDEQGVEGLEQWQDYATPPSVVFQGGPVEPSAIIGVAAIPHGGAVPDTGFAFVLGDIGTVDLTAPPDEIGFLIERFRVFRGYAGWGPGQLEGELDLDAWIVVDGHVSDAFTDDPDGLWRRVLGRQPGQLSWLAEFPDDLSLN
jgi:putative transcriptional regulator